MQAIKEQTSAIRWYYEGLAENSFRAVSCRSCGAYTFPPTGCCEHCASWDVERVQLSGNATLLYASHNIVPACHPRFEKMAPYVYGHLRLAEGPFAQAIVLGVQANARDLRALFERGPVAAKAETLHMDDLPVIAFRVTG